MRAWAEGWWRLPLTMGDEVGRIIGAPPGSVAMNQNVSVCQALILSCFDHRGRRNKIVYEELNFPSVMYVYEAHRRLGARICTVKSDDGITVPLERMLEAIDEEIVPTVADVHRRIARAIMDGQPDVAERRMRRHLEAFEQLLREQGRMDQPIVPRSHWRG